jgi:hypothetical protein
MFDYKTPCSQNILEDSSSTEIIWGLLNQKQEILAINIFVGFFAKMPPNSLGSLLS